MDEKYVESSQAVVDLERDAAIARARAAAQIPPGVPGECDLCGEHSSRLINGACAPCRDKHKLG